MEKHLSEVSFYRREPYLIPRTSQKQTQSNIENQPKFQNQKATNNTYIRGKSFKREGRRHVSHLWGCQNKRNNTIQTLNSLHKPNINTLQIGTNILIQ